ncbi:hypothetical protein [Aquimarina intermedia]|uniref:Uncharacterized protein n=1 Tax=Aquimarina intermedia TaxID=350814 RepID=A0A5S5BZ45_9FLAO|nr:hypothetical protein [Aquimarina intermedia]TYP71486.1 hypothetical protein BD809_10968 [Aquimarina intermedia]
MIILILIVFAISLYVIFQLIKGLYYLCLSIYYKVGSEKNVDEGFKKHVLKESNDYKNFEDSFDTQIGKILKD